MTSFLPWFALLVTVGAGWMMVKKFPNHMTLFLAGLLLIVVCILAGETNILPKGMKSSGLIWFDIFDLLRKCATSQVSGIGFVIMTAGGFAAYMDRIGAAKALVNLTTKPLGCLNSPYLVLVLGYLVGQALILVVPSAAGLAMLLLVALYPILRGVGISAAAAAAVIGMNAGMPMGPSSGTSNLASKVAGLDPVVYFVQCQLPVALPSIIVVCILLYFVNKYYDKKNDDVYGETVEVKAKEVPDVPGWYALFPLMPLVLMIIFSKLVYSAIKLNTISALFLVWAAVVLIELIRLRDAQKVFKDALAMFQAMGKLFTGIVALILCAQFFAEGLKISGLIDMLVESSKTVGMGMFGMSAVLSAIVGFITFLTGSGVAAYTSFAAMAPDVSAGLGGTASALVTPMQFASGFLRAMSPVSGVIIAVAGAAGLSPFAIVRRNWIPMLGGLITALIANYLILM